MPTPTSSSEQTPQERRRQQYRQPYRGRVRSGCLTCRSRKIKCGEERPLCDNCTRTGRACIYKPRKAQASSLPAVNHSQSRSQDEVITESAEVTVTRTLEAVRQSHVRSDSPLEVGPSNLVCRSAAVEFAPRDEPQDEHRDEGNARGPSLSLHDSIMDVRVRLQNALRRQCEMSTMDDDARAGAGAPSAFISRDIELTTTMDILASRETPLQETFSYFIDVVECPTITPYDSVNWQRIKLHIAELGRSDSVISSAVVAVSALHKLQTFGLPLSSATSLYEVAKGKVEHCLHSDTGNFDTILVAIFLLCVFEFVSYETTPFLRQPDEIFLERLDRWAQTETPLSIISLRLTAWLELLYVATIRGGRGGLVSDRVYSLLPGFKAGTPNISPLSRKEPDPSEDLYELLSIPVFEFYFSLQIISGNIAKLSHYRRSRTTSVDQEEVAQLITTLRGQLHALWSNRSAVQHQTQTQLLSLLAHEIARPLITLNDICAAAYYAELVEIDRVLGDPVSRSSEAAQARRRIQEIVDGDWEFSEERGLNVGYLRPLFLFAIECMDHGENRWAVECMRQIRDPIHRSDFFAAFGEALADEQLRKDRRVTSKYFCLGHFGVPPPFI